MTDPDLTPAHLATTTFYSHDEWDSAYRQLGDHPEWPAMVDWVRNGVFRPRQLPDIVTFLETPMTLEERHRAIDRIADCFKGQRTPAPSAAWRTTWRDIIVPILAPTESARLVRPRWKRAGSRLATDPAKVIDQEAPPT